MKNSPAAQRCLRRGLERPSPRFLLLFFTIQYTALKGNYSSSWIPVRFTSFYWTTTTLFYKNALMVQPPLSLFGSLLVLSRMCGVWSLCLSSPFPCLLVVIIKFIIRPDLLNVEFFHTNLDLNFTAKLCSDRSVIY